MRIAVYAVNNLDDNEQKEKLIKLAENGVQPFEGFSVAASVCIFSRWKCKEKDYDAAIAFAERATKADESYAEGHALLGWYKLFIEHSDPIEHFKDAVNRDSDYLAKITNAPEMKDFPNIISELRKLKILKRQAGP